MTSLFAGHRKLIATVLLATAAVLLLLSLVLDAYQLGWIALLTIGVMVWMSIDAALRIRVSLRRFADDNTKLLLRVMDRVKELEHQMSNLVSSSADIEDSVRVLSERSAQLAPVTKSQALSLVKIGSRLEHLDATPRGREDPQDAWRRDYLAQRLVAAGVGSINQDQWETYTELDWALSKVQEYRDVTLSPELSAQGIAIHPHLNAKSSSTDDTNGVRFSALPMKEAALAITSTRIHILRADEVPPEGSEELLCDLWGRYLRVFAVSKESR